MTRTPSQLLRTMMRAVIAALIMGFAPLALADEMEAYANIPNGDIRDFSTAQLRAVFLGHTRTWPDGTPTQVVVLEDSSSVHKKFCRDVLRVFSHQFRSNWNRKIYSGTGQSPARVRSLEEMQSIVDRVPGAIGYRFVDEATSDSKDEAAQ